MSWIIAALDDLERTLASKNEDYKISGEFSNFEFAGYVTGSGTEEAILNQLAIKVGRVMGLRGESGEASNHEGILDSYKDLAGYAVIAYAWLLSQSDEDPPPPQLKIYTKEDGDEYAKQVSAFWDPEWGSPAG